MSLKQRADQVAMTVHDNGKGITTDQSASAKSLGIMGMRERAHSLGGELTITGAPDQGTTIEVTIPLAEKERPHD